MDDWISAPEAAEYLAQHKNKNIARSRKMLVAGLALGSVGATCESYWRDVAIPGGTDQPISQSVPADFWRPEMATHTVWSSAGGTYPSIRGFWGGDGHDCRFTHEFVLSADAALTRYPDLGFGQLYTLGSDPVQIVFTAIGVKVWRLDIEALARQSVEAVIRKAERAPALAWGNVTKSEAMTVIARGMADLMQGARRGDDETTLDFLKRHAESEAKEQALSDAKMRQFANIVDRMIALNPRAPID